MILAWRVLIAGESHYMVSFHEALDLLLQNTPLLAVESCRLENATGRVLRQGIAADRPFPAFDRVMMDGYALKSSDWGSGQRFFRMTGSAPAGQMRAAMSAELGTCMEVMTGAPCPLGADLIVPVEEVTSRQLGVVRFSQKYEPVLGRYIHREGSDAAAGEILLEPGRLMGSCEIGVAASCGAAVLEVSKKPRIAVIATGDELVAIDRKPLLHQIRQSNGHSLASALTKAGHAPATVGVIGDEVAVAEPMLEKLIAGHDWLVLTGAVSKGSRDFVPLLLAELGCRAVFHGVAQRPGKPAGCWIGPAGQLIMALPGNPVSALTGLHAFVFPALAVASGQPLPRPRLVELVDRNMALPDFTRHLPVTLRSDGRAEAAPTGNSGDFIGLLNSHGFITLPPRGSAMTAFPYTPWH